MKRVLVVTPSFPPFNTPDLQRVRMSLPYYQEFGWEPLVLSVDAVHQEGVQEPELSFTVPPQIRQFSCGAIPFSLSRRFGVRNLGLRSWWHLLWAGAKIIEKEKPDLVFFSTTQFVTFTLGRIWRAWFGTPYVIDLQDPWRTDYYERPGVRRPPGGWKYQAARLQAAVLEGWALRHLAGLMSVSEGYIHDLKNRYEWFRDKPARTLRFGASENDLRIAATSVKTTLVPSHDDGFVHLVYTGAAGPITPHAAQFLFDAISALRSKDRALAERLRFHFIGSNYARGSEAEPVLLPLAKAAGISELVREVPARVGHLECLQLQANADVLLLLGSSDLSYSPSKIYPYFLARRPIISLVFRKSYLASIVRELNCAKIIEIDSPDREKAMRELLLCLEAAARCDFHQLETERNEMYFRENYLARDLTAQQTALFEEALGHTSDVRI